jgi:hypothetical protein
VFADAYIPVSPIVPMAQVPLLVVIILLEGFVIWRRTSPSMGRARFWLSVAGANIVTTLIGVVLVIPLVHWEEFLLSHMRGEEPGFVLVLLFPWLVWAFCYQISWRTEARLLTKWFGQNSADSQKLVLATQRAHRWSYALLALSIVGWLCFIFPDI